MSRNLDRRVEVVAPILDETLLKELSEEVIPIMLGDNIQAWDLQSDGTYVRRKPGRGFEGQEFADSAGGAVPGIVGGFVSEGHLGRRRSAAGFSQWQWISCKFWSYLIEPMG